MPFKPIFNTDMEARKAESIEGKRRTAEEGRGGFGKGE